MLLLVRKLHLKKVAQNKSRRMRVSNQTGISVNQRRNYILLPKLFYCEKKNVLLIKKILKFEAEGQEFANVLRSLEQFIQAVKGQNNFW